MKVLVNVTLVEGTDQNEFVASYEKNKDVELKNPLVSIPTLLVMRVEETYLDEFRQDPRVVSATEPRTELAPVSLTYETQTGSVIVERTDLFTIGNDGSDYMPLQLYDDADVFPQTTIVGNDPDDDTNLLENVTYYSAFFGKNVDIVSVEVGPTVSIYNNYHTDPHPDFQDPDNLSNSRFIPMDWTDLEADSNKQVTNGDYFTSHSIGVLSSAAGRICGFAKKASIRATYLEGDDGNPVEHINAIISWHNSKSNNPETGVPDPTIMIQEYQYLLDKYWFVEVDDVVSIHTTTGTTSRPGSSWGTDLSPFVDANILPIRLERSSDSTWLWAIPFPINPVFEELKTALEAAWDAGIVCITASGNQAGVYVKSDDAEYNNYCRTTDNPLTYYTRTLDANTFITSVDTNTTTLGNLAWYPNRAFGPHGCKRDKSIDVGAGQNSQKYPILDTYSNRGKGIDIIGKGSDSFSAHPQYTMNDGKWGYFSGTSAATPTVAGKAACEMEKYFYYNGSWPTPNQVKEILLDQAKDEAYGVDSTDWSSVEDPSTSFTVTEDEEGSTLARFETGISPNGGVRYADLVGSTGLRAFFNARGFDRSNTVSYRPTTGGVYPRPRIRR